MPPPYATRTTPPLKPIQLIPIPHYPGYSSSDVLRDVADASKHAKLNRADSRLTNADQVKKQLIGAMGTAPMGMLKAVDTRATLNDGQSFNLAYVVRNAAEVWRKKLGLL